MDNCIHASSVCFKDEAVLITGKSGVGKSDLVLRLIDAGATLISDDRTILSHENGEIFVSPHHLIKGLLEIRGVGIKAFPFKEKVRLKIAINLLDENKEERMPDMQKLMIMGKEIPLLRLYSFNMSTVIKVKLAMMESL